MTEAFKFLVDLHTFFLAFLASCEFEFFGFEYNLLHLFLGFIFFAMIMYAFWKGADF